MQPRKGQLQAVEAVGLLKKQFDASVQLRLFGYDHFDPAYLAACKEMAERHGVSSLVSFSGFAADAAAAISGIDVVLCANDSESIPQAIPEAMAAGRLVVAPNAGVIGDIVSRDTGIPMPDHTAVSILHGLAATLKLTAGDWRYKTSLAREVARRECSQYPVAAELFRLYSQAAAGHARTLELPGTIVRQSPKQLPDSPPTDNTNGAHPGLRWLDALKFLRR